MSQEEKQKNKSRRWPRILGMFIAIVGLILSLLPIVIEWGAEKWLQENGATQANVADVDLNLFTGRFVVSGVEAGTTEGQKLKVGVARLEVNWQALFEHRIEIERIELSDAVIDVRPIASGQTPTGVAVGELNFLSSPASVAAPKPENKTPSDWGVGINAIVVNNVVINHLDPSLSNHLQIKHLELGLLASWLKDNPTKLRAELLVNGASFNIDSTLQPFQQTPQVAAKIRLSALDLKSYSPLIEPAGLLKPAGNIEFDLTLEASYKDERELSLTLDGSVAVADLYAELDDLVIGQKMLRWQGQVNYLVNFNNSAESSLTSAGSAVLDSLNIHDKKSGLTLLELAQAEFKGIKVAELERISLTEVSLKQLQALKKENTNDAVFVTLGDVLLNGMTLTDMNHLVINDITLEQLAVDVAIAKDGKVALLDDLAKPSPESEPEKTVVEPQTDAPGFVFEVGQLTITKNSEIKFVDDSVVPAYQMAMSPLELTLKKINSAAPKQSTELDLNITLNEYASFSLEGTLQPFAEKISSQLKGELKSLDLPPLSSYSGKYMGYHLQRGRLNTQFDIKIVDDELDVNNTLLLSKLLLEEMDGEAAKGFADKLGMPLNAALDLLRDGDDNIEFDLPVTGNLNDPTFELSGVMKLALTKGMQMAAMSYIKNALQPLGTIMLVTDLVGKATALRFQPLVFDAGSAEFNDDGRVYLEKLATVLNDRPNIQLTLCGVSTSADQLIIEAQRKAVVEDGDEEKTPEGIEDEAVSEPVDIRVTLLDLATQRGELVKTYFITQQDVSPERLFACNAKFSDDEDALPSVAISL